MQTYLIKNTNIVNEGTIIAADVLIQSERIEKIAPVINPSGNVKEINGENRFLLPGAIDDQVHFREPGLTHKATIYSEAKAAVAGGVTSFMEMPNTVPPVFTQELLENKYQIAVSSSLANYSFFMGTSNENADEALKTNEKKDRVCGIKIFMGSSTGGLLVNNPNTLNRLFSESEVLIATHCEDERIIKANIEKMKALGKTITPSDHPIIRNEENCYESSLYAIQIAKKYNSRLHILHISTEKELQLFSNLLPLKDKRITAEVCVHHLHFTADDYAQLGYRIKCNPAIKAAFNRQELWNALLDDRLDIIATDHAPHTIQEKGYYKNEKGELVISNFGKVLYENAHAGLPLVQHSLLLMLHYVKKGQLTIEKLVEKMCHAPAVCFQLAERGYIREGYFADLVLLNMNSSTLVRQNNILYKCGWSPLEGMELPGCIEYTFVNGHPVYGNGVWNESYCGRRLLFNRD